MRASQSGCGLTGRLAESGLARFAKPYVSRALAPGNANGYPDKASTDGVIGKVTYSWNPSDEVMYYVTWSEGFRPGLALPPTPHPSARSTHLR